MNKLQQLVTKRARELDLKPIRAAQEAGLGRDFIRDILRGKKTSIKMEFIDQLAHALQMDSDELRKVTQADAQPPVFASMSLAAKPAPAPNASFPPKYQAFRSDSYIPLLGQSVAGPNGRFILNGSEIGRLFVPPSLEGVEGAYAVRVYGTSMEPRFKAGETVWINPNEPVRQGDDVIVQIVRDDDDIPESYIKEFRSRTNKLTKLWQHNPEEGEANEMVFPSDIVFTVHKVVFHATV